VTSVDRPVLVLGAGYVGLITAVGLVRLGHRVELVETREDRRSLLEQGRVPIFEPGVGEILGPALADGRLSIMASPGSAAPAVAYVCVGTPIDDEGVSDLSQLDAAFDGMGPAFAAGAAVVIRSTTPVGGTRRLIAARELPERQMFLNPEFLRQGTALADFMAPTRVVVGWSGRGDTQLVERVESAFEGLAGPRMRVTFEEAELIKNASNAFLALRLSFANELAVLSESYDADVQAVMRGVSLDPRMGTGNLRPSFGFGGSCLPKELKTITRAGWERGVSMHVTAAASAANRGTQEHFAQRVLEAVGGGANRTIAVLGLAFKAGTDDVRDSPALYLARLLHGEGATVRGYDPQATANAHRAAPWLTLASSAEEALRGADAAVIATEWPEFAGLDWRGIRDDMARAIVADGRRLLDGEGMRDLGFTYLAVGSGYPAQDDVSSSLSRPVADQQGVADGQAVSSSPLGA
jgi:UDPglucose 6-dehydrogenase